MDIYEYNLEKLQDITRTKKKVRSLVRQLKILQSEDQKDLIDPDRLAIMVKFTTDLKDYYAAIVSGALQSINAIEDGDERDILTLVYLDGKTHAATMRELELKKQNYWIKHRRAVEAFSMPDVASSLKKPVEADYIKWSTLELSYQSKSSDRDPYNILFPIEFSGDLTAVFQHDLHSCNITLHREQFPDIVKRSVWHAHIQPVHRLYKGNK